MNNDHSNGSVNNAEQLTRLVENSERMTRLMQQMYGDRRRNIESECGYVETGQITAWDYQRLWDRDPVAGRVVNVFPMESWQQPPQLIEDEDVENVTDFEAAWTEVGKNIITSGSDGWYRDDQVNSLWTYLERADIYSGIGSYGCVLFGIDDGRELREPADLTAKGNRKLNYIRILSECEARISIFDNDDKSMRYGRPEMYSVITGLPTLSTGGEYVGSVTGVTQTQTKEVHWSRIQHVVDNPYGAEVGGIPRMQQPYNRLYDLHKMYGGSTEMYWQGAFPGISFETHPQLGGDVQIDQTAMRSQLVNYTQGLQRYLTMAGMTAKTLSPTVVDPSANIDKLIEAICILTGIPKRIFMGSERGELASTTDLKSWYNRCRHRQTSYITPFLIARFIDRLILLGVLPIPSKGYGVSWPDLAAASDLEKAQIAVQRTTAMSSYVMGGLYQLIDPKDFLSRVVGFDESETNQILEDTQNNMEQMQEANLEQRTAPPEPPQQGQVGNEEYDQGLHEIVWDDEARVDNVIVKTSKGYVVKSEHKGADGKRRKLGGPYATRAKAEKRLQQVEYFKHVDNTWSDKAREASAEERKAKAKYLTEAASEAGATANRVDTHKAHSEAANWYAMATDATKEVNSLDPKARALLTKHLYHKDQADKIKSGAGSDRQRKLEATRKAEAATKEANSTKNPLKAAKLHTAAAKANTDAGRTEQAKLHADKARQLSERVVEADSTSQRQTKLDTVAAKASKAANKASKEVTSGVSVSSGPTRTGGRAFGKVPIDPANYPRLHKQAAELHTKAATQQEAAGNTELATYHKERAKHHTEQSKVSNTLVENAKFSSTQLTVHDPEVHVAVRLLQDMINLSDVVELETQPHITVRYGLHTQDANDVAKWVANAGPMLVTVGRLSVFSDNPEYDVLKYEINSNPVRNLNRQLGLLDNTNTYEYNPHMTVAYVRKGTGLAYTEVLPNTLFNTRLVFYSLTFSNVDKQRTELPLLIGL